MTWKSWVLNTVSRIVAVVIGWSFIIIVYPWIVDLWLKWGWH